MLATPSYVAGPGELSPDLAQLLNWASWVLSLPVLLFSAGPFFSGMWHSLRRRRISMDVPVALGVAVTFVASTGATFDPGGIFGTEVYFDSMTMFVSFLLAARYFELHARHRAAQSLEAALDSMPQQAQRLLADGRSETVSVMRLAPGDRVRVALGQAFPADGVLVEGSTHADEALLSGESTPVPKVPGDALVAGSVNLGAPVTMQVQRVGADTRHEAIVALMRDAMSQRPSLARVADRWAGPFLWAVLGLAALAAVAWSLIDPSRAVWVAVSVLIVTCPCALSLAVPAALVAAAGGAGASWRAGAAARCAGKHGPPGPAVHRQDRHADHPGAAVAAGAHPCAERGAAVDSGRIGGGRVAGGVVAASVVAMHWRPPPGRRRPGCGRRSKSWPGAGCAAATRRA